MFLLLLIAIGGWEGFKVTVGKLPLPALLVIIGKQPTQLIVLFMIINLRNWIFFSSCDSFELKTTTTLGHAAVFGSCCFFDGNSMAEYHSQ